MHPNIFLEQIWQGEETNEVFVAMSFLPEHEDRFNFIFKPAIEAIFINGTKLRANRVDESKSGDSIVTDIIRGIAQSCVVLADVSAMSLSEAVQDVVRNGNVMYELGIAHAVKSPAKVIIIRDDDKKLLFDVTTIPHTKIDFQDRVAAKKEITRLIADRLKEDEVILDIKLRNFLNAMTPNELELLETLAKCPPGKIADLTVDGLGLGRRLTPLPVNAGIVGLRFAGAIQAHHITDSTVPLYSLSKRGRQLCKLLGIAIEEASGTPN